MTRRVKHKKRGTTYRVIGEGSIQTGFPLEDMDVVVVYQSEQDGRIWVRSAAEFTDGRFENMVDAPDESSVLRRRLALAAAYIEGRLNGVLDNDRDALIRLWMEVRG